MTALLNTRLEAVMNYAKLGACITEKRFNRLNAGKNTDLYDYTKEELETKRIKAKEKLDKFLLEQIIGSKNNYYKKTYGISSQEVHDIKIKQNNCCAICGGKTKRALSVDHCHKSGRVRGLLCSPCNLGIGMLRDDIEILENAINYLKESL